MVDVIKPDTKEAEALTGLHVTDRDSARQAAHHLVKQGVKAVSVQAGSQGDLLVWYRGERWLPLIPVKAVDATGAGDTFAAALAVALAGGRSLEEAGPFASAAPALTLSPLTAKPDLTAITWKSSAQVLLLSWEGLVFLSCRKVLFGVYAFVGLCY